MRAPEPRPRAGPARAVLADGRRRGRPRRCPPLCAAVKAARHPVVWACDPMHGNTFLHASGYKTRHFDDVMRELHGFFAVCRAADVWPGGVHVELTGEDVTECLGGSDEVLGEPARTALRDDVRPAAQRAASRSTSPSRSPSCSAAEPAARRWCRDHPRTDRDEPDRLRGPRPQLLGRRGDVPALPRRSRLRRRELARLLRRLPPPHRGRRRRRRRSTACPAGACPADACPAGTATAGSPPPRHAARRRRRGPRAPPGRRGAHRREHGVEPRRADGDLRARGARQAARGQPPDPQQPPRPHRRREGQLHAPHRVRGRPRPRRLPEPELELRRRRRQAGRDRATRTSTSASPSTSSGATAPARCIVPNIKGADTLDFAGFWAAYEELIRRIRTGQISPDDFADTTGTITNPGMIGTVHSVPRLMPGQGFILGVGSIGFPAEYEGADRATLAQLGVGTVTTLTNTYDHRIISGAESGEFLRRIHDLILGDDGFYDDVFRSFGVPYEPARWSTDHGALADPVAQNEKAVQVHQLINMYRVRGHLIANLDPLGRRGPVTHPELDPSHHGLGIWDLDREFPIGSLGAGGIDRATLPLRDILGLLRDAYRAHGRRRVHAHPGARPEGVDPGARRGTAHRAHPRREAADPRAPERGRGVRALPPHEVPRPEALQPRRGRDVDPAARRAVQPRGRRGHRRGDRGNGPPRPAQRARQRDRQVVRADLPRVRGRARSGRHPGFGRREVPPRRHGEAPFTRRPRGDPHPRREPQPPRGGGSRRRGHGPRQARTGSVPRSAAGGCCPS